MSYVICASSKYIIFIRRWECTGTNDDFYVVQLLRPFPNMQKRDKKGEEKPCKTL